jgi:hypothetical protein
MHAEHTTPVTCRFWDITQHIVVIPYWCFGTTYPSHLKGSSGCPLKMGLIGCPETSLRGMWTHMTKWQTQSLEDTTENGWSGNFSTSWNSILRSCILLIICGSKLWYLLFWLALVMDLIEEGEGCPDLRPPQVHDKPLALPSLLDFLYSSVHNGP